MIINFQKMKRDKIIDLSAENMFLYEFYKKGFIKKRIAILRMKFVTDYRKLEVEKRGKEILKQVKLSIEKNTEEYKKYGIIK